jgi:hypothetical protein
MPASSCRRSAPAEWPFASAFGARRRQPARAPGSKTICISAFDQEGVLLAATRKRSDDLNSVTSCLKLGQAPYATEGRIDGRSCSPQAPGRTIFFQTREVGTVAALEGYRKVDANNPTK